MHFVERKQTHIARQLLQMCMTVFASFFWTFLVMQTQQTPQWRSYMYGSGTFIVESKECCYTLWSFSVCIFLFAFTKRFHCQCGCTISLSHNAHFFNGNDGTFGICEKDKKGNEMCAKRTNMARCERPWIHSVHMLFVGFSLFVLHHFYDLTPSSYIRQFHFDFQFDGEIWRIWFFFSLLINETVDDIEWILLLAVHYDEWIICILHYLSIPRDKMYAIKDLLARFWPAQSNIFPIGFDRISV